MSRVEHLPSDEVSRKLNKIAFLCSDTCFKIVVMSCCLTFKKILETWTFSRRMIRTTSSPPQKLVEHWLPRRYGSRAPVCLERCVLGGNLSGAGALVRGRLSHLHLNIGSRKLESKRRSSSWIGPLSPELFWYDNMRLRPHKADQ